MLIKSKRIHVKTVAKKEQKVDEFLPTLNSIFHKARFFGVTNFELTKMLYWSIVLFSLLLILESFALWKVMKFLGGLAQHTNGNRGIIGRLSGSIFYGNALLSLVLSSTFVHSWKRIYTYWVHVETTVGLKIGPDTKIKQRVVFVTCVVATFAIEHSLSMMSATGFDVPPNEYFERYILNSHGFIIHDHDYSLWVAIPIFVVSKLATALWNFQDLIIMLLSMGLSSRYHRLNLYVGQVVKIENRFRDKQKFGTDLFYRLHVWRRLREAYVRQGTLVRLVDKKLGSLVLLSNFSNLYFICLQLFFGLHKEKESTINKVYYFLSLGWLMFRACRVVMAASDVHLHSKRALIYLGSCPDNAYNIEIKRLQYQLSHDYVALTGMGFFTLKRGLLLEVAAAVVKYELVLIQYDTD